MRMAILSLHRFHTLNAQIRTLRCHMVLLPGVCTLALMSAQTGRVGRVVASLSSGPMTTALEKLSAAGVGGSDSLGVSVKPALRWTPIPAMPVVATLSTPACCLA